MEPRPMRLLILTLFLFSFVGVFNSSCSEQTSSDFVEQPYDEMEEELGLTN